MRASPSRKRAAAAASSKHLLKVPSNRESAVTGAPFPLSGSAQTSITAIAGLQKLLHLPSIMCHVRRAACRMPSRSLLAADAELFHAGLGLSTGDRQGFG